MSTFLHANIIVLHFRGRENPHIFPILKKKIDQYFKYFYCGTEVFHYL